MDDATPLKTCKKCLVTKKVSDFYAGRPRKDGSRGTKAVCKACDLARTGHNAKINPERCRKSSRKHYYSHLESERERQRTSHRKSRHTNRFRLALRDSRKTARQCGYLSCTATAEEIELAFTGFCCYCGVKESEIKLCMDHCHKTGTFRGWLCRTCNRRDVLE